MLNFKNLSLRRGHRLLFNRASFTVHRGEKVGLTGANGVGKSSLFALVLGRLHSDEGEYTAPPGLEIAHVAQETPALATPAIDYVMDGDSELRTLQGRLASAELDDDGTLLAELHERLEIIDGYTAVHRASRLMSGLGFSNERQTLPVNAFSGGWRMRLNLAQALMCRSDVLLLDEPTNHLDLDAVIWLQDWLLQYPGTLLLISHDRDFLDAITDHILHIENEQISIYSGNYSAFERMRAEKLAQQQASYERQQREIAHVQSFIDRFKAKATKAKQAQSRMKQLQRMELIVQAHVDSPFHFTFAQPDKLPNPLIMLDSVCLGYGEQTIIDNVSLSIAPGDRLGLLGANGAGKSTLIRVLAGTMLPLSGTVQRADALKIGYFAQHQLEQLVVEESPLWHCQRLDGLASEKDLRNFLAGFDFRGDKVYDPVGPFSGGEKARLVLALLVYQNPNLLLLDEPTNHLDLDMRDALSIALQEFSGAMIVVSHDRHLLTTVTDQLLLVANRTLTEFNGDLQDYREWLAADKQATAEKASSGGGSVSRKEQRKNDAERRKKLKPLVDALKKAEASVEDYLHRQRQLEQQLSDPTLYEEQNKSQLKRVVADKAAVDLALENAEQAWISAELELEQAESECTN